MLKFSNLRKKKFGIVMYCIPMFLLNSHSFYNTHTQTHTLSVSHPFSFHLCARLIFILTIMKNDDVWNFFRNRRFLDNAY